MKWYYYPQDDKLIRSLKRLTLEEVIVEDVEDVSQSMELEMEMDEPEEESMVMELDADVPEFGTDVGRLTRYESKTQFMEIEPEPKGQYG